MKYKSSPASSIFIGSFESRTLFQCPQSKSVPFLLFQNCEKLSTMPNIAAHIFRAILGGHFLVLQYRRKVSGALDIAAHIFHAILRELFLVSQYRDQLVATQYCRLLLFQRKKEFLPFGRNSFLFIGTLNEIRTHTP